MKEAQPRTIFLKDYKKPPFLIDETVLHFDLSEQGATVKSRLSIRRNPDADTAPQDLYLDGVDLELAAIAIDGVELSGSGYELIAEGLRVIDVADNFLLECETRIKPHENTCLEGLYKSSSMFCTQCEAEGFRRITYYLDRPDVMSRFTTTIVADKNLYPILLSNGNQVERGDLDADRHFVTWEDPFRKPCYLFALVAGDLLNIDDEYTTMSGRKVALRMFVEPQNKDKCSHALNSLKASMKWDEEVYGREYDLDIFMIVAVDDFNMGAMENKGLNIFNSSCVLAKPDTATDATYQRIEAIVAHEYFHNWSGNRVTCRDWFQLSLKEGFTVFRDAEFSADMNSRTVKRIEDVNLLRTAQFAEDAGPMSHPVRPASFIEISNFYTLTIYEKGAEVVGMIYRLLGAELFRKGSDLYFERHDGQAVTTDDFVQAMQDASGKDLTQFKRWYDLAGTPVIAVDYEYDQDGQTFTLKLSQSCPSTAGDVVEKPFHIPFSFALLDNNGCNIPLIQDDDAVFANAPTELVLDFVKTEQIFTFQHIEKRPIPSLLRGFSAPVRIKNTYSRDELLFLMSNETDGFNRWDAGQKLAVEIIREVAESYAQGAELTVDQRLIEAYRGLLVSESIDKALLSKMLLLPTESYLIELSETANVDAIHHARNFVRDTVAKALKSELLKCYQDNLEAETAYSADFRSIAKRSLKNIALGLLLSIGDAEALTLAETQFATAENMTDESASLIALVNSDFIAPREAALETFYAKWKADPQVVEQWLSIQCGSVKSGSLEAVKRLMSHEAFDIKNPNKVRSVIGAFCNQNIVSFHNANGQGYAFLADNVIKLNKLNPQIASRLVTPLTRWKKFDEQRQALMQAQLKRILDEENLSKDVYEVVSKSIK
ncbi:aminopeptidase N [Alkalimarinus sediminis]|uniref:Aminopeptidase N n=1 Tax=Alkalimarinus sediminis TaxID=1632866 RepID=A0A9E8HSH1_9ALTE|nr:aminopeptidase N [Alkalimarinus sediminis]UZW75716.1 aminopeptidase N [Alkalimarinus sediminis]